MYSLSVENPYGEKMELTHNANYTISNIDGIDPPDADINTTRNAGEDGSIYNSAYINPRTITITLAINYPAESNRINLYRYFKSKFPVTLYYENETRKVYIKGYVQTMQISFFGKKQTAQIVINCPKPLFNGQDEDVQEFAGINPVFEFPFALEEAGEPFSEIELDQEKVVVNNGDIETGVLIRIHAIGAIVNPKIYNTGTNEHIFINYTLRAGDDITINTMRGEKSITLRRDGAETGIIGAFVIGSAWIQLAPGDNVFAVAADSGLENMVVTMTIIDQFEGV